MSLFASQSQLIFNSSHFELELIPVRNNIQLHFFLLQIVMYRKLQVQITFKSVLTEESFFSVENFTSEII